MSQIDLIQYLPKQVAALQDEFEKMGCVFDFAVFRVNEYATADESMHRKALGNLCDKCHDKIRRHHEMILQKYPNAAGHLKLPEFRLEQAKATKLFNDQVARLLSIQKLNEAKQVVGDLLYAFTDPPYGTRWSESQGVQFFQQWCELLGLNTKHRPEVMDWVGDGVFTDQETNAARASWSEYFEDGLEWWGIWCLTIWNPQKRTIAALMASATD